MTRMTNAQEKERERYESAGVDLASALVLLETQVALRIQQAVRQDARLRGLLSPALDECEYVLRLLSQHRDVVAEAWALHQDNGWRPVG